MYSASIRFCVSLIPSAFTAIDPVVIASRIASGVRARSDSRVGVRSSAWLGVAHAAARLEETERLDRLRRRDGRHREHGGAQEHAPGETSDHGGMISPDELGDWDMFSAVYSARRIRVSLVLR
jgi:hypothetical protein